MEFERIIQYMAGQGLRCISFAHKQVPTEYDTSKEDELILLGVVGIRDPICRPGVKEAVDDFYNAGVNVKMIHRRQHFHCKAISRECGILRANEDSSSRAVIEGVEFRNYSERERIERADDIRMMARSSPPDKLLLVESLKQKGHVVAVVGDGTNDAPALKKPDIGLSMGIQGTKITKESSDIIIMNEDLDTLVTVFKYGRCIYNNSQKSSQFYAMVNVAVLVINLVVGVSTSHELFTKGVRVTVAHLNNIHAWVSGSCHEKTCKRTYGEVIYGLKKSASHHQHHVEEHLIWSSVPNISPLSSTSANQCRA